MKLEKYTRREAIQLWVWVLLLSTTSTAWAVESVLSSSVLEKRLSALSKCNWENFQAGKISLTEQSISIGRVEIEFADWEEKLSWNDCGSTLSRDDVSEIQWIIAWDAQQQVFFFREVLWMNQGEYWLADLISYDRQKTLQIKSESWLTIESLWDWWWTREDILPVRKKI